MAKDPAMLWYWSDWHSGTITLSRFLKGCYMDILHAQFNSGRLTLEEIKTVLGSDFGTAWPTLLKKFKVDETGKFFNERLETEKEKRANFTASRRKNLESSHIDKHMETHTEQRMENENVIVNEIRDSIKKESAKKVPRATMENEGKTNGQDFTKPDVEGDTIIFPLDTKPMRELWAGWKKSRWDNYRIRYPVMGEQADLKRFEGMNFSQIEQTILAAIGGGWKNLYPERQNGKANGTSGINKKQEHVNSVKQQVADHYAQKFGAGPSKPGG